MSFRMKTLVGIAAIEGVLLFILVLSSLNYLRDSNDLELHHRAQTTAQLFAASSKNAILSSDLATLNALIQEALSNPGVVYLRVKGQGRVLEQGGDAEALARPFVADDDLDQVADGVFDTYANVSVAGADFGRIELGLSVEEMNLRLVNARQHITSIALLEVMLVALFSLILGSYLTRQLSRLTVAAKQIADGQMGLQVEVIGNDEIARAVRSFNHMSSRVKALYDEVQSDKDRLRAIMETVVDGIITINEHGVIESVNTAACHIFGYRVEEMLGRNVTMLMPESFQGDHDAHIQGHLHIGQSKIIGRNRELKGVRKNGTEFPLEVAVSKMTLNDKKFFVGALRDLSDVKEANEKLKESRILQGAVLDSALDCIITIDGKGRVLEFNPSAEQTFGYRRNEIIGQPMADFIIPEHYRSAHMQGIAHYLKNGRHHVLGRRIDITAIRKSGEEFPIELAITPIDLNGKTVFTAYLRDISERLRAEADLRYAKTQAEAASQAKSDFLAVMSHEIRTPMNAILGSLSILDETPLQPEQKRFLDTAEQAGRAMLWLINDILDFSKIEAGKLELEQSEIDIVALVEETVELMVPRARDKGIALTTYFDPGLPARVEGDPGRFRQIVLNLVSNAVKFTDEGGVQIIVSADRDERIRFEVSDSGIGIPEEIQMSLFQEFVQANSAYSRKYGGTGLGLAISSRLARMMEGDIGVNSQPGEGSRFWVTLKLPRVADAGLLGVPEGLPENVRLSIANTVVRNGLCKQLLAWGVGVEQRLSETGDTPLLEIMGPGESRVVVLKDVTVMCSITELEMPVKQAVLIAVLQGRKVVQACNENTAIEQVAVAPDGTGRILLVEDSQANQMVAIAMLERGGYEVDAVANGLEAVEAVGRFRYDLVLMDLSMPEMDGIEATKRIRAQQGKLGAMPIIAMTANAMEQDLQRCLEAGMDDYITKPVDKHKLLVMVRKWLEQNVPEAVVGGNQKKNETLDEVCINLKILAQLEEDTSAEFVPKMMEVYFRETRKRFDVVDAAIRSRDLQCLKDEAHALKSSAGTMGAAALQELAKAVELACKAGNEEEAFRMACEVKNVGQHCIAQLAQHYDVEVNDV